MNAENARLENTGPSNRVEDVEQENTGPTKMVLKQSNSDIRKA